MRKKKKEYIDISIAYLIRQISKKEIVLPSLQRKYVWSHQQICQLFDSIMQDYPIGTFMFWKIGNRSTNDKMLRKRLMFYEFLRDYNKNEDLGSGIEFKPAISGKGPITNVIDGQQRITSLLIGLTGSYFKNRAESKLYINLNMRKKSSEEEEFKYEFKFLSDNQFNRHYKKLQKISADTDIWFPVYKCGEISKFYSNDKRYTQKLDKFIFECKNFLSEKLQNNELKERNWNKYSKVLDDLFYKVYNDTVISYFELEKTSLTDIVDIFIRVNNGGTNLTKTEMLMSVVTSVWRDGRSKIDKFLKKINNNGEFDFDVDFIMRASLFIMDKDVLVTQENVLESANEIQKKWESIKSSITQAVNVISEENFSKSSLRSKNSIIPIAYYFAKTNKGSVSTTSTTQMIQYLNTVQVLGFYGNHGDQALRQIRKAMQAYLKKSSEFKFDTIKDEYEKLGNFKKLLRITKNDIDILLNSQYGKSSFAVLSCLNSQNRIAISKYDTSGGDAEKKVHQDHIYPISKVKHFENSQDDFENETYRKYNSVVNLHFFIGRLNKEKQDKMPKDFFKNFAPKKQKEITETSLIPVEFDKLDAGYFDTFYKKRRELLRKELLSVFNI
tara:strand:- start:107 stop:1942 length:1836 start_codon:yes stop_codon:yes gene_type:complete